MEAAADLDFPLPSVEELAGICVSSFAYELPAHQLACYHHYVCSMLLPCAGLRKVEDLDKDKGGEAMRNPNNNTTASSSAKFGPSMMSAENSSDGDGASRTYRVAMRDEQRLGAWSVRCELSSRGGAGGVLDGKRVVMKDNMAVRGLPMYCGTPFFFAPLVDSPLVLRCLMAGATVVGKGQCEYMCLSAASHTASAGLVRNPVAPDYHAGGSSSGCAALVAAGEADLSIGCDQGGSCRIPAAMCGVVGCKPTHGLVPYTFIDGMYAPIDHAGPITRTVEENAVMLGVLAGWDGVDERPSPAARCTEKVDYCKTLKEGVKGMRIGMVTEALMMPFVDKDVKKAIQDSASVLREMGAQVEAVSIPLHCTAPGVFAMFVLPRQVERLFYSQEKDILLGVDEHGKVYDRLTFLREKLLAHVASWSVPFRLSILAGEWLRVHFPDSLKVAELHKQQLIEGYCSALLQFDALLLPTTAWKAKKLTTHLSTAEDYENASAELVAEHAEMVAGLLQFTSCFNLTGHPAVSVPVGGGVRKSGEGEGDGAPMLPIGAMLVANYFQEALLYRVAYALEQGHQQQSPLLFQ